MSVCLILFLSTTVCLYTMNVDHVKKKVFECMCVYVQANGCGVTGWSLVELQCAEKKESAD